MSNHEQEGSSSESPKQPNDKGVESTKSQYVASTKHKEKNNTIIVNVTSPDSDKTEFIEANRIARKANKISFWSTVVSFLLFLVTVGLAGIAINQYHSSQSAAQIADSTFLATKRYNDSSLRIQQKAFKSNDSVSKANLRFQDSSFKVLQIENLKENAPYLQIEVVSVGFYQDKLLNFAYKINNLGKQPAKETGGSINAVYILKKDIHEFYSDPFKKEGIWSAMSNYVTNSIPTQNNVSFNTSIDEINSFKARELDVYILGRFDYINAINKKERMYKFVIQIKYIADNKTQYKLLYNENTVVK